MTLIAICGAQCSVDMLKFAALEAMPLTIATIPLVHQTTINICRQARTVADVSVSDILLYNHVPHVPVLAEKHFVTKSRCNYRTSTTPTSLIVKVEMASFSTAFAGQQLPCAGAQSLARPITAGKRCGRGRTITRSVMSPRKSQLDGWKEEQDKSDAFEKLQALSSRQSRNRKQKVGTQISCCCILSSEAPH